MQQFYSNFTSQHVYVEQQPNVSTYYAYLSKYERLVQSFDLTDTFVHPYPKDPPSSKVASSGGLSVFEVPSYTEGEGSDELKLGLWEGGG